MNIGVDAAALGMSNAVTAMTGDVNSTYWNPAGILNIEDSEAALMHASYFANIAQYDFAAYAKKIDDRSAWGISLIRFGVDDILNTTQLIDSQGNIDYNRISLFSTADYGLMLSYARRPTLIEGLQYGVNAKIIRRVIGDFASSWGFGFDFGLQYESNDWHYGLMLRDITTTYNVWAIDEDKYNAIKDAVAGQNQEPPESTEITLPKAQLGVAKKFDLRDYSLLAAVNLNMQFAKTHDVLASDMVSIDPALGLEFGYTDLVFLRAGVGNFQNVEQLDGSTKVNFQPNIGLGFKYKGIQVDYALTDLGDQSAALYSNIFSVKVDLSIFR
ncbi:MAG TPA: PorV/PorQ family protein [Flavobacterium sp.]|uniref:putative type IX sorting system protein PorV2 n=1 Tax=Flavobacterium sp. TaxID=239 RepID=UPI002C9423F5|nr:PorV/PorQ family protein [Flavobacterium sp.]HNP33411.1 PorV/PorQ family protein [Flavobacterium sp.]